MQEIKLMAELKNEGTCVTRTTERRCEYLISNEISVSLFGRYASRNFRNLTR